MIPVDTGVVLLHVTVVVMRQVFCRYKHLNTDENDNIIVPDNGDDYYFDVLATNVT